MAQESLGVRNRKEAKEIEKIGEVRDVEELKEVEGPGVLVRVGKLIEVSAGFSVGKLDGRFIRLCPNLLDAEGASQWIQRLKPRQR